MAQIKREPGYELTISMSEGVRYAAFERNKECKIKLEESKPRKLQRLNHFSSCDVAGKALQSNRSVRTANKYTHMRPGLNYAVRCNNRYCERFNDSSVRIPKRFGLFDLVKEVAWNSIKCPECQLSAILERLILHKTNYIIQCESWENPQEIFDDRPRWCEYKIFSFDANIPYQQFVVITKPKRQTIDINNRLPIYRNVGPKSLFPQYK